MLPYFRKPHSPDPGPGPPLALLLGSCRCQGALAPPRGQRAALTRTATFQGLRCNRAGLGRRRLDQKTCPSGRLSSGQPGRPPCIHSLGQAGGAHGDWVLSHPGAGARSFCLGFPSLPGGVGRALLPQVGPVLDPPPSLTERSLCCTLCLEGAGLPGAQETRAQHSLQRVPGSEQPSSRGRARGEGVSRLSLCTQVPLPPHFPPQALPASHLTITVLGGDRSS